MSSKSCFSKCNLSRREVRESSETAAKVLFSSDDTGYKEHGKHPKLLL